MPLTRLLFLISLLLCSHASIAQDSERISESCDNAFGVFLADINKDGHDDIVSSSIFGIFWSKYVSPGEFAKATILIEYTENSVYMVDCRDFDGDGDTDFLMRRGQDMFFFYRCDGDFIYNETPNQQAFGDLSRMTVEDLNADGLMDFVALSDDKLRSWINQGDLFFESQVLQTFPAYTTLGYVILDINQDGQKDIIYRMYLSNLYAIHYNDGTGFFLDDVQMLITNGASIIDHIDMNGDGYKDLICYISPESTGQSTGLLSVVSIYWNSGQNTFDSNDRVAIQLPTTTYRGVDVMDWNQDGNMDIIALQENQYDNPNDANNFLFTTKYFDINDDWSITLVKESYTNRYLPRLFRDLNGDGFQDGLQHDSSEGFIGWLDFHDAETDVVHQLDQSVGSDQDVFIDDFTNDELNDMLVFNSTYGAVGIYRNTPIGLGQVEMLYDAQFTSSEIFVQDNDSDGDLDFIICSNNWSVGDIVIATNDQGEFSFQFFEHPAGEGARHYFTDITGDGRVDYVYSVEGETRFYRSSTAGFFDAAPYSINYQGPVRAIRDYNNDGLKDLFLYNEQFIGQYHLGQDLTGVSYTYNAPFSAVMGNGIFSEEIFYNEDTIPDLVARNTNPNWIAIGTEDGYQSPVAGPQISWGSKYLDFNNDGLTDYCFKTSAQVWYLMQNVGGDFEPMGILQGVTSLISAGILSDSNVVEVIDMRKRQLYRQPVDLLPAPEFIECYVFWDENENGQREENEVLLEMPFMVTTSESSYYSSSNGYFNYIANGLPGQISLVYDSEIWQITTDSTVYSFTGETLNSMTEIIFGLTPLNTSAAVEISQDMIDFGCTMTSFNVLISLRNEGNTLESGSLLIEWDQSVFPIISYPDDVVVSTEGIEFVVDNLLPESNAYFWFTVEHPGVAYMDSLFTSVSTYTSSLLSVVDETASIIECAYDPNMIVQSPKGMGTQGFVLPAQEMEYTIHFENLGTAPAYLVRIENIFSEYLDYSRMEVIASSHTVNYNYSEGRAQFLFDDIVLMPTSANSMESRGFVTYKIPIKSDAPMMEPIANRAQIFFDLNPAIETNIASNQVFDCELLRGWTYVDTSICVGLSTFDEARASYAMNYNWFVNSAPVSSEISFGSEWLNDGLYYLSLTTSNDLCEVENVGALQVYPLPSPIIQQDGMYLFTDAYNEIQWLLDDVDIVGDSLSQLILGVNGNYSVRVVDANGCVNKSAPWVHVIDSPQIYPNPVVNKTLNITLTSSSGNVVFYDATGREVLETTLTRWNSLDLSGLSFGLYYMRLTDATNSSIYSILIP
jgi:hypothetical protein